jgi:replicative DNA helicase
VSGPPGPAGSVRARVPPHDLEAETSVLGAILLDPAAITRILELLSPEDFYRENNGQVFRAAVNLFREGEPIDNVTLAAELGKLGVLERVGGRAHLGLLQESVPTAANVEHYARIVKDRAYKRRLISAGTQVTTLGYDESLDADEAVNQAQAHVYAISDQKVGSGLERIYDLLKPAMDRIDAQMATGGGVIGIPSGFHDLDRMTNGFKASDLAIIAGRPSMGKALALDTPIPTPHGWTTMGALQVGDPVFDEAGRPCTVTYATPVQVGRDCYEVQFSDGSVLVADAHHLWATSDRASRQRGDGSLAVRTTREIQASLRTRDGRANHLIPVCGALQYPERELPIDPYVLGAWLGDDRFRYSGVELAGELLAIRVAVAGGRSRTAVADRYSASTAVASPAVDGRAWRRGPEDSLQAGLRRLRRPGEEHIPREYLQASVSQRAALLRGLMDSGGHVDELGHAELRTTSHRLAAGVAELVASLGVVALQTADTAHPFGPDGGARFRLTWLREVGEWRPSRSRRIHAIRQVASVPVRCIQVDGPSHLYLAGRSCIPTHNTSFVLNVTLHAAVERKKPVAIFSLEMSKEQLVERMLCEQARIDAQRLHRGTLSDVEYERLAGALGPLGDAPIFIDDSPTLDDLTLRLKARQARSREGIEMIVLDYLQLMQGRSNSADSNRVQEVSAISRALKSIARELRIPVIAISQLSRAPEARPDKRPILSDLRESGCMPASTRLLRADSGREVTMGELVLSQEQPMVWSIDSRLRLVPARLVRTFPTGIKPVFRLRLASGLEVDATANHRFRTIEGWRHLDELTTGAFVAVPRRLPAPESEQDRWDEDELQQVRTAMTAACVTHRQPATAIGERYCGSYLLGSGARPRRFARARLERMGSVTGDAELVDLATSDVFWDEIVEIVPQGEMPTFDATVEETHNFVANGIIAHNSIEQDADIVMFLYRDEYYNREKSEKPGIAEIIVAKHRNGPTGMIELMFRKELTRFENLERRRPEPVGPE